MVLAHESDLAGLGPASPSGPFHANDEFVHSSAGETCYEVAPATPAAVAGSLFLALGLQFYNDIHTSITLNSLRARLGT